MGSGSGGSRLRLLGWIVSVLVILVMAADGLVQLFAPQTLADAMAHTGFALHQGAIIGALALLCTLFYAVPQTAVLGAVLITGFMGGAITAHVRVGDYATAEVAIALLIGVAAWGGLWLRDARLRALLPLSS